ncbi:hypothetical protein LHP98_18535 [Rhodobacter sp. Har01]|uniref:hypothetical protein n=1 Tax=Rhodobacter sp. Har01 TaxID=2883999 RepID=UPI001D08BF43|nr:hypothetical protein [Rhodobacter sp. Har01]MCB6180120.1 hypothetical protein [Rhodobacter sp. Har01]
MRRLFPIIRFVSLTGGALLVNALGFVVQALGLKQIARLYPDSALQAAAPVLMLGFWCALGFGLRWALGRLTPWPGVCFVIPPVIFTLILLGLHVISPPNEFVTVFLRLWFIPVGYALGGLLAHRSVGQARPAR